MIKLKLLADNSVGDIPKLKNKHYSANFKKDYLAYFTIGLFFVVVAIEIYMAVWLPIYLESQGKWAIQENRQEMLDRFDGLRRSYSRTRPSSLQAKNEIAIIKKCLDNNAIYLREYQSDMNMDQIKALTSDYNSFHSFLKIYLRKDKKSGKYKLSLGKERKLKTSTMLKKLKIDTEAQLNIQIKQYNKNGYIQ